MYSGLKFSDDTGKMVSVSKANPLPTAGGGGGSDWNKTVRRV